MSKRWIIYRNNGDILGPLPAADIREALRSGRVEAFDHAQAEGSSQRQELVEIDEIFQTSAAPSSSSPGAGEDATTILPPAAARATVVQASPQPRPTPEPRPADEGARYLGLADPSVDQSVLFPPKGNRTKLSSPKQRDERSRDEDKKYYLIDKQRQKNGPFSASEIHALYHQHNLSERLQVRKRGTPTEVSLRQFISIYEANQPASPPKPRDRQAPAQAGRAPQRATPGQPPVYARAASPMKPLTYRDTSNRHVAIIAGLITLVSVAALLFVFYPNNTSSRNSRAGERSAGRSTEERANPSAASSSRPSESAPEQSEATDSINMLDAQNLRKVPRNSSRARPEATKVAAPSASEAELRQQSSGPAAPAEAVNHIASLKKARSKNNQIVTLGPLTFSEKSLRTCKVKCTLNMYDAAGRVVVVKFFKAAYITPLTGKGSAVFVTGLLSDSGKSMYLSRVY